MTDASDADEPILVEFYTAKKHAYLLKAAPPIPAAQAPPRWYRETDSHFRKVTPFQVYPPELRLRQNATIKACPGIRDHLTAGFILPLWADVAITFEDGGYRWESPQTDFVIDKHDPEQYAKMPRPGFPIALKFMSPWFCRTPPGTSIRILPCFYHFDHLWSAMPGVVNTDSVHVTHLNVLFEPTRGQIVLSQGTPLAQIIPFRRERHALGLHVASDAELEEEEATARRFASFFHDAELYPKGTG